MSDLIDQQETQAGTQSTGNSRLRFLTCGSVDDGKSTLIGRLLHDCGQVAEDIIDAARRQSPSGATGPGGLDFAYLLDGLEAEREQGITIDVSYRSFLTPERAFQVADCPGHAQYTRNMVTAASNCEVAILLIDARKGLLEQTRRHATVCAMLGIKEIALAVNKMDLVDWSQETFDTITGEFSILAKRLKFNAVTAIPTAATSGINLVTKLGSPQWYTGETLLNWLEHVVPTKGVGSQSLRLPIQWVARPDQDTRAYLGTISSGHINVGQTVQVGHSGQAIAIKSVLVAGQTATHAATGDAVAVQLSDHVDLTRGDILCDLDPAPDFATQFVADVIWFNASPMTPGRTFLVKSASGWVSGTVLRLKHRVDLESATEISARILNMNDIGLCEFSTSRPMLCDPYTTHPASGGFIMIDEITNETIGAGMMRHSLRRSGNITPVSAAIDQGARTARFGHKPLVVWLTGLSGSGKSTIAKLTETQLWSQNISTAMLDGDNLRGGLCRDLGFSDSDRVENIRRTAETAKLLTQSGLVVICALISPSRRDREMAEQVIGAEQFLEVFVDTSLQTCIARDPKGLYAKALKGDIPNFTGIGSDYEAPLNPDVHLVTSELDAPALAQIVAEQAIRLISL
jgi:bifunctional enzyme CysN/CysC